MIIYRPVSVSVFSKNGKKTGLDWTLKHYLARIKISALPVVPIAFG
jgi:hypothetical protein